jgi:hypothetical protein
MGRKKSTYQPLLTKSRLIGNRPCFTQTNLFEVYPGDKITGNINVLKAKVNPRELDVYLEYQVNGNEKVSQYYRIS